MKACYFCNPDIILTLLEAGADIDAETEQGRTALHELWYAPALLDMFSRLMFVNALFSVVHPHGSRRRICHW